MKRWIVAACALVVACGGEQGRTPPVPDAQSSQTPGDMAVGGIGTSPVDAGPSHPSGDLAGVLSTPCGGGCGGNQVCDGTSCVDLPARCPCPLGSYCDLGSNSCVKGCLGNDHCPSSEVCDTSTYQCLLACKYGQTCPGNLVCNQRIAGGSFVCPRCIEAHGDMGASCECIENTADCNHDPSDGCETPLRTLTDCYGCGEPATAHCIDDKDRDGYGVSSTAQVACYCPAGTIDKGYSKGEDCDDTDYAANPGFTGWATGPRKSGGFDFNCDGVIDQQYQLTVGKCALSCDRGVWEGAAPGCGQTANAYSCYADNTGECVPTGSADSLTQGCR